MTAIPQGCGANVRLNPLNAPANRRKVVPRVKLPLAGTIGGIQIYKYTAEEADRWGTFPPFPQKM